MKRSGFYAQHRIALALTALVGLVILLGYSWGKTSSAYSSTGKQSQPALANLLNSDGTLNLASGFSGSLDTQGYRLEYTPSGAPRFMPMMAPGDENWDPQFSLPGMNGSVNAIAVSGSDVYVGGSFTTAGGVSANNIAKWDGSSWSTLGIGTDAGVNVITVSGSDVYVGGSFTSAGGISASRIAKWDGSSWSNLGSGVANNTVNAIAVSGSDVYVGGSFTSAGGASGTNNIAKWNSNSLSWSQLSAGAAGPVYSIAVSGSDVYVGGGFTGVGPSGTVGANRIARWNSSWSALGSGTNGDVKAITVSGSDVYVGGNFTTAGGASANRIAKWSSNSWSALGSGVDNNINAITVSGSDVYVGGSFTTADGVSASQIAKWNSSTLSWSALGSGTGGSVNAIVVSGSSVYAGGQFSGAGGVSASNIARWDGGSWLALGSGHGVSSGSSVTVYAIAVSGSDVYVGGTFTIVGGVSANNIAKWNGSSWSALGSGTNNTVSAIGVSGSDVYVSGIFTIAGGVSAIQLAKWNSSTLSWSTVGSGTNGLVNAIAVSGSDVYMGGSFTTAGGVSASRIAKWNTSTLSWSALGSGTNGNVSAIAVSGNDVYVGGSFTTAGGVSASRIAKWNGSTWSPLGSGTNGNVFAIAVSGSDVYVGGGAFTTAGGVSASRIAKWNSSTLSWSALGTGTDAGVNVITVSGSDIYVGGSFATAGGISVNSIAKWNGSSWSALGSGINGIVHAIALSGSDVYVGGNFSTAGGKPSSMFSRYSALTCLPPSITAPPSNQAVCAGTPANFSVTATGTSLSYQWRKGGVNLADGGNVSGATSATLTINPAAAGDAGSYDVIVTEACGLSTTSNTEMLTVNSYAITPTSHLARPGGDGGVIFVTTGGDCAWTAVSNDGWITLVFGASGTGDGVVAYNVLANTNPTPRTGTITVAGHSFTITQERSQCITSLNYVPLSHAPGGGTGSFTISAPADCDWAMVITPPSDIPGFSLTSPVSGIGNGTVSYAFDANATTNPRLGTVRISDTGAQVGQLGLWAAGCTTAPINIEQTLNGELTTSDCRSAAWSADTYADRYSFTGGAGQQVAVTVAGALSQPFVYLIGPAGGAVADNRIGDSPARIPYFPPEAFFTLPAAGEYVIEITTFVANVTGNYSVNLTSCAAPAISTQPANQTVTVGQSATFSIGATGDNLSYQWRKNGADIAGATASSYTIHAALPTDGGNYDVVVTGSCGSITSNAATLTVSPMMPDTAFIQHAMLAANDGATNDGFGFAVAVSGDTLVVGAQSHDVGANANQGAAYVFVRTGGNWTLQQKLTVSDGAASDLFGFAVAIHNDTIVVGAQFDDGLGGSAYVFVRSGAIWTEQQKLTAEIRSTDDRFGYSVAISNDTVVVGSTSDDVGANANQGSAYIFTRSGATWTLQQQLLAGDGAANEGFGYSVAVNGDSAVIGAALDDFGPNTDQGSAYVFTRSGATWTQQQKLFAPDGVGGEFFGYSVAISGDTVVAGIPGDAIGENATQGSAIVFVRSGGTWSAQQKLIASDGTAADNFGFSVAISGDTAVAGALSNDVGSNVNQGSAYVFTRQGNVWTTQQKLTANDGAADDQFGIAVAISGGTVAVGANRDDVGVGTDQGSVYVFSNTCNAPLLTNQPDPVIACTGASASFSATASGAPMPSVQWQVSTDNGANFNDIAGATSATLTLNNVTAAFNNYLYRAVFTNACSTATSNTALLNVNDINVNPAAIPDGVVGSAYSQSFIVTGAFSSPTFSLSGTVPGLAFAVPSAVLSGTPMQAGSFPITVSATADACTGSRSYTLNIGLLNLAATGGEGYVDLNWTHSGFAQISEYRLHRATSSNGMFTLVHQATGGLSHHDTTVMPNTQYFYKLTIVRPDGVESSFSNVAAATPTDLAPPVITHTPVAGPLPPGVAIPISATVTDNTGVQSVKLFFRTTGGGAYTERAMTANGNVYSATILTGEVAVPGVEYYIEARDLVSVARSGQSDNPHRVTITDRPFIDTISPTSGPSSGGTQVTITGYNFKANPVVRFDAAIATISSATATQIVCATPPHFPAVVDVQVLNNDGASDARTGAFSFQGAGATLSLPGNASGPQNVRVQIPINAASVQGLTAADLHITFDSTVISPVSVATGTLTPGWSLQPNLSVPGEVRLATASAGGAVNGTGTLAVVEFDVPGAPGSVTPLSFSAVTLNGGAIQFTTANGQFTVSPVYTISGTVRHWFTNGGLNNVALALTGDRSYPATSDPSGAYSLGGVLGGNYTLTPSKSDDVAGISALDAARALLHTVGLNTLTGPALIAADVNRNNTVNAQDAFYILQYAVGLINVPFPGAGRVWDFSPQTRSYANLNADQTGQDFAGILLGDINGNFTGGNNPATLATLTLPEASVPAGAEFSLLTGLGLPQGQLLGAELQINYDPAVVTMLGVEGGGLVSDWMQAVNLGTPGVARVALAGSRAVTQGGELLRLRLRAVGAVSSTSTITITQASLNEGVISYTALPGRVTVAAPSALLVSGVAPATGPTSGGTTITLTGANFLPGATVTIGGVAATNVTRLNANTILATTPAHASGVVDVVAANPGGSQAALVRGFAFSDGNPCQYTLTPTSQSFTADGGSGSVTVTTADGCAWTSTSNDLWITLAASGGTGSGPIGYVVAANTGPARSGTATIAGQTFTVNQAAACPTVTSITPTSGAIGANLTITGTNFTDVTAVKFNNNVTASFTVVNTNTITAIVPAGAVTGAITISKTGCADVSTAVFTVTTGSGLQFFPLPSPVRLLDTRFGVSPNACTQPNAPITGGTSLAQAARGICGIPADAKALTGNVTTVNSGGGYLTLFPTDASQPIVASTNYGPNEIINNVFTVALGAADGAFNIFAVNTTDVVVDVTGYYAPPATGGLYFHPLPAPVRLLETRTNQPVGCVKPGGPLNAGADTLQTAIGACTGIPAEARAIVGNATTVGPQANGYLTLFPANADRPVVASSNYGAGQVVNGPFAVGLSPTGQFKIFTPATTDLVVDVLGYFSAEAVDANGAGLLFTPLAQPVRLLETRSQPTNLPGCFKPNAPLNGDQTYTQTARGLCDGLTIPASALSVVGNATAVFPNGNGHLTLWPDAAAQPTTATSNYNAGQIVNRHFIVGLGNANGAFKMFSLATTDLVIDISGYFAP